MFYDGLLATPDATAEARSAGAALISSIAAAKLPPGSVRSFGNVALVDVCSKDGTALEVRRKFYGYIPYSLFLTS
jgi:hypothetical protein